MILKQSKLYIFLYLLFNSQLISNVPYYDKVINDPTLPKYISDFISFKQDMKLLEIKCKYKLNINNYNIIFSY